MSRPKIIKKEMGLTHKDFYRTIEQALGPGAIKINSNTVVFVNVRGKLVIELGEERERKISLLRFPVTDVKMKFLGYSDDSIVKALKRFSLYFKRGGG